MGAVGVGQVQGDKLPGHRWVDADVGLEAEEVVLAPQAASMLDPSSVTSSPPLERKNQRRFSCILAVTTDARCTRARDR